MNQQGHEQQDIPELLPQEDGVRPRFLNFQIRIPKFDLSATHTYEASSKLGEESVIPKQESLKTPKKSKKTKEQLSIVRRSPRKHNPEDAKLWTDVYRNRRWPWA